MGAMILSASRRCDLPAFRMGWLMDSLRAGYCEVPNPFDARRVRRVELDPDSADCIVFWTRDPRGLAARAREIEGQGYRFYVHATITGYPEALEPGALRASEALAAFASLADAVGSERALWRYDPILLAREIGPEWHLRNFEALASALAGRTRRVTLSLLDEYARTRARLERAGFHDIAFGTARAAPARLPGGGPAPAAEASEAAEEFALEPEPTPRKPALPAEPYPELLAALAAIARSRGMEPVACAEPYDLSGLGVARGACVDATLIRKLFGIEVGAGKDKGQRPECGCAPSVDIGGYGACPAGCAYCYARR
jgi:hypothetical protein